MIEFTQAPASLPPGQRIYAIGDIHGCLERLVSVHELIAEDIAERPVDEATLIHLGDYVDRGLDSAQVVDWLMSGPPVPVNRTVNLMGNHENMMLAAVLAPRGEDCDLWLGNGGAETLLSWGIASHRPEINWAATIGGPALVFLRDLATCYRCGPYLFVHAGIRPGVDLAKQTRQDMLWIREPFLSSKLDHGVVVVHGHTPSRAPVVRPNRLGLDTGAVMGGSLTCAVLEEDRLGFIQT